MTRVKNNNSTLGRYGCRWIYMGQEMGYRWVCGENFAPGGNLRGLGRFGALDPTAVLATPAIQKGVNEVVPPITNGGFDIMQFLTDNWIWIAAGLAAVVILPMILKKK